MIDFKIGNLRLYQPIDGVPVLRIIAGKYSSYIPFAKPVEVGKVSDNESYAIYSASKSAKLTVKTTGTGNVRTNVQVIFKEVE